MNDIKIRIQRVVDKDKKCVPNFDSGLGFGRHFSDHMFLMEYVDGSWRNLRVEPYHNLSFYPSTMIFHYGQGIFEGMKAYRRKDDLYLFRPRKNLERMNNSAKRMVMPTFDSEQILDAIKLLVCMDREWIPETAGAALYIRPTMVATEPCLGVRPSSSYLFFVIVGPVGAYYAGGFNPVDIYVCQNYVRAVPGGVGEAKTMGNYAASLLAQKEGQTYGCNQVLWLDGLKRRYIEEVGAMNIFVRFQDELATPALTGSILPGITRDSVLQIAKDWGIRVTERSIAIDEVIEGIESGKVVEIFGVGTAAVISPIGRLVFGEQRYQVADGKTGDLSQRLFDYITSLQLGLVPDKFGFVEKIDYGAFAAYF
ncbi:MAG: branched-chain amino acid aminotransferase [Oligoflexia bacterium]|nr:branched-chain amino acid aminotransferase [Oligoflexia bacterium]